MRSVAGFVYAGISGLILAPSPALAQSCAMCRGVVQSGSDPLAHGINTSVFFMVSMPFAVVGVIGGWLVYTYRRAGRERALAARATPEQMQGMETLPEVSH